MNNLVDYITESKFRGHEYYRDGKNLVEDETSIAKIWDDGTVEFYDTCKLNEPSRIALLKLLTRRSPDMNDLWYNNMRFEDGKMKKDV